MGNPKPAENGLLAGCRSQFFEAQPPVPVESNANILVVQPAENWAANMTVAGLTIASAS